MRWAQYTDSENEVGHPSNSGLLGPQYGAQHAIEMEIGQLKEKLANVHAELEHMDDAEAAASWRPVENPSSDGAQGSASTDSSTGLEHTSPTIRIGKKVAEERDQLASAYSALGTNAVAEPDKPDIVGWWLEERDLYYKLQVFDRPDTVRYARALDLLGEHWTARIQEFWEVDEDRKANFNEYAQYCKPNAGASTYCNQIWESQVIDNKHVRFLVSGPCTPKPKKVLAGTLDEQWTPAIQEYWRWRLAKMEQKKTLGYLDSEGYGRNDTLDDNGVPLPGSPPFSPDRRPSSRSKADVELDEISQMIENAQALFRGRNKERVADAGVEKGNIMLYPCLSLATS